MILQPPLNTKMGRKKVIESFLQIGEKLLNKMLIFIAKCCIITTPCFWRNIMRKKYVEKRPKATSYIIVNKKASTVRPATPNVTNSPNTTSNSQEEVKETPVLCGDQR